MEHITRNKNGEFSTLVSLSTRVVKVVGLRFQQLINQSSTPNRQIFNRLNVCVGLKLSGLTAYLLCFNRSPSVSFQSCWRHIHWIFFVLYECRL